MFYSLEHTYLELLWLNLFLSLLILGGAIIHGIDILISFLAYSLLVFRDTTDLYIDLVFYNLIYSFLISHIYIFYTLGFSMCKIMPSTNRDGFYLFLPNQDAFYSWVFVVIDVVFVCLQNCSG